MQDLSTGEMKQIETLLPEAKDKVIPIRAHQGPVFSIGDELIIRGGRFRVYAITQKRLYLDSIPL